jgi:hypothetical protein
MANMEPVAKCKGQKRKNYKQMKRIKCSIQPDMDPECLGWEDPDPEYIIPDPQHCKEDLNGGLRRIH